MKYIGAILYIQKLTISKTMWIVLLIFTIIIIWYLSVHPDFVIVNGSITQTTFLGHTDDGTTQVRDNYILYMLLLLLMGFFIISNIVPVLLHRDNAEVILLKPLSRFEIFICSYIVGLSFIGIIFFILFAGIWFLMGIQYGYWNTNYITGFLIILYLIAILYAYVVLIGLLSRSGGITVLFSFILGFVLPITLEVRERFLYPLFESDVANRIIDGIYYILPPTADLLGMSVNVTFFEPVTLFQLWNGIAVIPLLTISVYYYKNISF